MNPPIQPIEAKLRIANSAPLKIQNISSANSGVSFMTKKMISIIIPPTKQRSPKKSKNMNVNKTRVFYG